MSTRLIDSPWGPVLVEALDDVGPLPPGPWGQPVPPQAVVPQPATSPTEHSAWAHARSPLPDTPLCTACWVEGRAR